MNIRKDSAFASLSEDECELLLELAKDRSLKELADLVARRPQPIKCSIPAMRKLLKRLDIEKRLEGVEENADVVEMMSKRAADPAVRDATMAIMRERMLGAAVESNNQERLMETYRMLEEEKNKERAALLEERKIKTIEENAKIGWRKMELEIARAGLKALPRVRAALEDASRSPEERVSAALQLLGQVEAPQLLLGDGKG